MIAVCNPLKFGVILLAVLVCACGKDEGYYSRKNPNEGFNGTVLSYLESKPGIYDSLLRVVKRLGLEDVLRDSTVTVFAPSNASFQLALTNLNNLRKRNDRDPEYLENVDKTQLDTMVAQYIIRGYYTSDSLKTKDGLTLLSTRFGYPMHARLNDNSSSGFVNGGPSSIQFSDTKRSLFERDWVSTTTGSVNIAAFNGVVHVLNPDHVFGFDDFSRRLTYIPPPPNLFFLIGGTYQAEREAGAGPDSREASKYAFDGIPGTKFLVGGMGSVWLQYELNEPAVANAYTITTGYDSEAYPERDPADWTLLASNDGENWVTLDNRLDEEFAQNAITRVYRINNRTAYKFYRLNITRVRSGGTLQIGDFTVNRDE